MRSTSFGALITSVALLVSTGCKEDEAPIADPLADPWVDAIAADEDLPPASGGAEALPGAEEPSQAEARAPTLADAPTPAEQPPAAGLLASPAEPAGATTPRDSGSGAAPPAATPEQPSAEAAAVAEPALAPEPPAAIESAPAPAAEPDKPASPPPITRADFNGSYRFVGGSAQRKDLEAALETTVEALPRALHGIARKRLTATNPVEGTVDIVVAGDKLTTSFESGFTATCEVDGGAAKATDIEGGKLEVRVRWKDGKLVQHMQGKGGARTVVYVLSADRKKLTVHHKITSDRLPVPLTYRFSYSRN